MKVISIPAEQLGLLEGVCREPAADRGYSRRERIALFNRAASILKKLDLVHLENGEDIRSISYGVNHLGHYEVIISFGYIEKSVRAPGPQKS